MKLTPLITTIVIPVLMLFQTALAQFPNRDATLPGVQQILTQYGDQLELTDEQASELVALSLDYRRMRAPDRRRMEGERFQRSGRRTPGIESRGINRSDATFNRGIRSRPGMVAGRRDSLYHQIHEVLNDQQSETLKSLLMDRENELITYRSLRHETLLNRAGIEGERAEQIRDVMDRPLQIRREWNQHRIMNPGEVNPDQREELVRVRREANNELRELVTASEFEQLRAMKGPRSRRAMHSRRGW